MFIASPATDPRAAASSHEKSNIASLSALIQSAG